MQGPVASEIIRPGKIITCTPGKRNAARYNNLIYRIGSVDSSEFEQTPQAVHPDDDYWLCLCLKYAWFAAVSNKALRTNHCFASITAFCSVAKPFLRHCRCVPGRINIITYRAVCQSLPDLDGTVANTGIRDNSLTGAVNNHLMQSEYFLAAWLKVFRFPQR